MRQLGYISFSHIYSLYNKGLVQVQCAGRQDGVCSFVIRLKSFLDYLTGEDRKKIRNYLVVSNNFILSHSNITLSLLVVYVLAQCVARYGVSTKGLLYLPFVDFFVSNRFFLLYFDWSHVDTHGQGAVCVLAHAFQCGYLIPHYVI